MFFFPSRRLLPSVSAPDPVTRGKKLTGLRSQIRPIDTVDTFKNGPFDIIAPLFTFVALVSTGISFSESMTVAALATMAAYADHTQTGDAEYDKYKYHNIHHTFGQNYNFQQPFFTCFDSMFGTMHPKSNKKRNPFAP